MKYIQNLTFLTVFLTVIFNSVIASYIQNDSVGKSRQRRYLIYPPGTPFVQMVFGFGLPFEVNKQSVTIGPFVKSLYFLPRNASDYISPSLNIERKKRAASTRWHFYSSLSSAADFLGYGGKSCVLRAICEIAEIPFSEKADIFTEISHIIFTPSSTAESVLNHLDNEYLAAENLGKTTKNCNRLFPECKINLLEAFTKVFMHL